MQIARRGEDVKPPPSDTSGCARMGAVQLKVESTQPALPPSVRTGKTSRLELDTSEGM